MKSKEKAKHQQKRKNSQKLVKKNMVGENQMNFIKNFLGMLDQFSQFTKILNGPLMAATKIQFKIILYKCLA